ncbi:TPA: amidinotransferase [Klebsiella pneumoniae]|nr:amidinotransferase [Klebsiella pneumoniae]
MQTAQTVMMVRPAAFRANPETLTSNAFQKPLSAVEDVAEQARAAFDGYVAALRNAGVDVLVIDDNAKSETPDSLFPNNWIAMLEDGTIYTFPMEAHNRRRERRMDIIADLTRDFVVSRRVDLSGFETRNLYLEGTGSLILDHDNHIAYACRSSRSSWEAGQEFERLSGYHIHWFNACDRHLQSIYHTNVMMSVGAQFAIVCLQSLTSKLERLRLVTLLERTGKTIIDVTYAQMEAFACNVLELRNHFGQPVYAMSTRAWESFTPEQQALISGYASLALAPINIIEDLGGGGARCMVAEIFLEKKRVFI